MYNYRLFNEIIKFGECKDIGAVYSTIDSLKSLFKKDLIFNDTLNEIKNNYSSYNNDIINNIIENGYKEQFENNIIFPILDIFENIFNEKFIIVFNSSITFEGNEKGNSNGNEKENEKNNNKKITKNINDFDLYTLLYMLNSADKIIKNGVFVCENYKQYSLIKLQLLNILYNSTEDILFNDISEILNKIIYNDIDLIEPQQNIIYIGTEYNNNILTSLNNSSIISQESKLYIFVNIDLMKFDRDFKKMLLKNFTPNIIYKTNCNYWLFDCIPYECKMFEPTYITLIGYEKQKSQQGTEQGNEQGNEQEETEIEQNIIHSVGTDWTQIKKTKDDDIFDLNKFNFIKDIKLYELESNFYNEYNNLLISDDCEYVYNSNNHFNKMFIKKSLFNSCPKTIKIPINEILTYVGVKSTTIKEHGKGIYPLIDSVSWNHGIIARMDSYDIEADDNNVLLSVGARRSGKGLVFVHAYNLSRCKNIKLFRVSKEWTPKKETKKKLKKHYDFRKLMIKDKKITKEVEQKEITNEKTKTIIEKREMKENEKREQQEQQEMKETEDNDETETEQETTEEKQRKTYKINPYNVAFCLQRAIKEVIKDEDEDKYLNETHLLNLTIDLIV